MLNQLSKAKHRPIFGKDNSVHLSLCSHHCPGAQFAKTRRRFVDTGPSVYNIATAMCAQCIHAAKYNCFRDDGHQYALSRFWADRRQCLLRLRIRRTAQACGKGFCAEAGNSGVVIGCAPALIRLLIGCAPSNLPAKPYFLAEEEEEIWPGQAAQPATTANLGAALF